MPLSRRRRGSQEIPERPASASRMMRLIEERERLLQDSSGVEAAELRSYRQYLNEVRESMELVPPPRPSLRSPTVYWTQEYGEPMRFEPEPDNSVKDVKEAVQEILSSGMVSNPVQVLMNGEKTYHIFHDIGDLEMLVKVTTGDVRANNKIAKKYGITEMIARFAEREGLTLKMTDKKLLLDHRATDWVTQCEWKHPEEVDDSRMFPEPKNTGRPTVDDGTMTCWASDTMTFM